MAELALLASIVQIADTGYRLSLKLYTTGEAISSADRAIVTISKDISLTSTVLKELGHILGRDEDENDRICSDNLIQTAGNSVKECLEIFEELDKMILKNMPNLSQGNKGTRATMAMERLKWPFIQPRIQLLKGSLDMLRANISLMLNVLIYARHKSERKKSRVPTPTAYDEASQKTIIEELHNAKEEYVRKFESLKLSMPASSSSQTVHNVGSRAAPAHTEGNVVPAEHTLNPGSATTFRNAPTPQQMSQILSTTAFKSTPVSQHTFMPFSATTIQNTPAPQYTFDPFSASTFQSNPAPQWPLPDIPVSYPMMSKDPVISPSEGYNSWAIIHFDALVAKLVQEVYSPEYQIPVQSRWRFTGAIRETHRLEVVEVTRHKPIENSPYSSEIAGSSHNIFPPQAYASSQHTLDPTATSLYGTKDKPELSTRYDHASTTVGLEYPRKRQKTEPLCFDMSSADKAGYRADADSTVPFMRMPSRRPQAGYRTEQMNSSTVAAMRQQMPNFTPHNTSRKQSVQEADRNDIVDDLVKLWTVVR